MHVHPIGKEYLPLFVANGVTGIHMWGSPDHNEWRKQIQARQLLGPHMVIASPIIDGPQTYWPGSISVSTEQQARQSVDEVKKDGADFVKVYQLLPRKEYFANTDEAKKQGIPLAGMCQLRLRPRKLRGPVRRASSIWSASCPPVQVATLSCFRPNKRSWQTTWLQTGRNSGDQMRNKPGR